MRLKVVCQLCGRVGEVDLEEHEERPEGGWHRSFCAGGAGDDEYFDVWFCDGCFARHGRDWGKVYWAMQFGER